jgi:hypothetical protein
MTSPSVRGAVYSFVDLNPRIWIPRSLNPAGKNHFLQTNPPFQAKWHAACLEKLMKSDPGMGTLLTVFSGIAALMCLLVGFQLFFLESQIGQAVELGSAEPEHQFNQWRAQAHTGAIMSLGAGVLIFFLGLRHLIATGPRRENRPSDQEPVLPTVDLDSVSVRVFEVDARDHSVEITPGADDPGVPDPRPHESRPQKADLQESGSQLHPDLGSDIEPMADPADTIVRSIRAATAAPGPRTGPLASGFFRSFNLGRFFRNRRRH